MWAQYERILASLEWLNNINLTGDLFDLSPVVRDAAQFRTDFLSPSKRHLLLKCVIRHLSGKITGPRWMRLVVKTNVMRELLRLLPDEFHFRCFRGSLRALSGLKGWNLKRENRLCLNKARR